MANKKQEKQNVKYVLVDINQAGDIRANNDHQRKSIDYPGGTPAIFRLMEGEVIKKHPKESMLGCHLVEIQFEDRIDPEMFYVRESLIFDSVEEAKEERDKYYISSIPSIVAQLEDDRVFRGEMLKAVNSIGSALANFKSILEKYK